MERAILTLPQDVTRGRDSLTAKQKHTTNTHSTLDRPRISQCLTTFHERTKEEGGKSREPIEPWTPLFRKLTHTHTHPNPNDLEDRQMDVQQQCHAELDSLGFVYAKRSNRVLSNSKFRFAQNTTPPTTQTLVECNSFSFKSSSNF